MNISLHLLTYLGLEPLEGHRPSTTVRQRPRSWAIHSNSLQVQPVSLASASRSLLQVFFGRPLFLFPWGYQVKAWRVMFVDGFLRVCPIHHHLLLISSSAGTWLVLSQRSALLMVFGQWIFRILRRHELMKVWTLLMVVFVVLHVSAPYRRTDLTLELNRQILVQDVIRLDRQMFFRAMNAALAFPMRVLMSASVPPCWLITLPR